MGLCHSVSECLASLGSLVWGEGPCLAWCWFPWEDLGYLEIKIVSCPTSSPKNKEICFPTLFFVFLTGIYRKYSISSKI